MKLHLAIGHLFTLIGECRGIAERIDAELTIEAMKKEMDNSMPRGMSEAPKLWPGFYAAEFREIVFHLNISHKTFVCIVEDWYMTWERQAQGACGNNPIVNALYSLYCARAQDVIKFLGHDVNTTSKSVGPSF